IDPDDVEIAEDHGVLDIVPVGRIREEAVIHRARVADDRGEARRARRRDPGAHLHADAEHVGAPFFRHLGPLEDEAAGAPRPTRRRSPDRSSLATPPIPPTGAGPEARATRARAPDRSRA